MTARERGPWRRSKPARRCSTKNMAKEEKWSRAGVVRFVGGLRPHIEEEKERSEVRYITLRAQLAAIDRKVSETQSDVYEQAKVILNQEQAQWTWRDAKQAEQFMVELYNDNMLDTELGCRLVEASTNLGPKMVQWLHEKSEKTNDTEAKRALLLRLISDLQWQYTENWLTNNYKKQLASKTGFIFISAIVVFIVVMFIRNQLLGWLGFESYTMLLAAIAGCWGAAFSMLTGLKTRTDASKLEDLKLTRRFHLLLIKILVGVGAALILYFFLRSGLLKGDAFPDLSRRLPDNATGNCLGDTWNIWAFLIVWCFLAGFSEKLVPSLLAKTEGLGAEPAQQKPSAPRSERLK